MCFVAAARSRSVLDALPPELLERLRIGAPQLGLRQGEITAAAIDRFLKEHGF
jgi:hypothetical protein